MKITRRIVKMRHLLTAILIGLPLMLAAPGLGQGQHAGTEIVVADITRHTSNALRPFIREFEEETGISVRFEQYGSGDLFQRILLDVEAGTGNYDVMYLSPSWMGGLVEGGHLLALDDLIAEHDVDLDDFMPIGLELARYQDRPEIWSLPYLLTVKVLVYREDLFTDPAEMADFREIYGYDLAAPETMSQFADIAEFFTRDEDGDGEPELYGLAEPQKAHFQAWDWAQHLIWTFGGEVLNDDLEVVLLSDESIEAFEFGKQLQEFQPDAVLGWEYENRAFFESGRVAMMHAWHEVADELNEEGTSAVAGAVGYATLPRHDGNPEAPPAGQSRVGGGGLAILEHSRNPEAAFEFIKWVTSPELAKRLYREGGSIVRTSVFEDPELMTLRPWLDELFPVTRAALEKTARHRVSLPESFAIEEEIGQAWIRMVRGQATAEEALQTAHSNIERVLREAGYYD